MGKLKTSGTKKLCSKIWCAIIEDYDIFYNPVENHLLFVRGGYIPPEFSKVVGMMFGVDTNARGKGLELLRTALFNCTAPSVSLLWGLAEMSYGVAHLGKEFRQTLMLLVARYFAEQDVKNKVSGLWEMCKSTSKGVSPQLCRRVSRARSR